MSDFYESPNIFIAKRKWKKMGKVKEKYCGFKEKGLL